MNANGILINNSIDATTINISGSPYSVPSNKIFVITSIYNKDYFGDIFINDLEISGYSNYTYNSPLFLGENDQISVQNETFPVSLNGYLVNEDYFDTPQAYVSDALQSTDDMFAAMQEQINTLDSLTALFEYKFELLYRPLQESLDMGVSPFDLLSVGNTTEDLYGLNYGGGFIFYLDYDGLGFVASNSNLEYAYEFGCQDINIPGADSSGIGYGYQNTLDIINFGCSTEFGGISAAQAALDYEYNGYADWYLPSSEELSILCDYFSLYSSSIDVESGHDYYYRSSTEFDSENAIRVFGPNGSISHYLKRHKYNVRPIRTI